MKISLCRSRIPVESLHQHRELRSSGKGLLHDSLHNSCGDTHERHGRWEDAGWQIQCVCHGSDNVPQFHAVRSDDVIGFSRASHLSGCNHSRRDVAGVDRPHWGGSVSHNRKVRSGPNHQCQMIQHVVTDSVDHSRSQDDVVEAACPDDLFAPPLRIVIGKIRCVPCDDNTDVNQAANFCQLHYGNKVPDKLDVHRFKRLISFRPLDTSEIHDNIGTSE